MLPAYTYLAKPTFFSLQGVNDSFVFVVVVVVVVDDVDPPRKQSKKSAHLIRHGRNA